MLLMLLGLIKLSFVFVGGKTFDKHGRRVGLSASLLGMASALLLVSAAFTLQDGRAATIFVFVGMAIYLSFFSCGMGPGAWLIPSEVFATIIRAKAMSVATCASRIFAAVLTSTFLTIADAMGWPSFFCLLAGICLTVCAFFLTFLPETKGKSLEDMSLYFAELTGDHSLLNAESELEDLRRVDASLYSDEPSDTDI